jgi:hypothetical protein
MKIRDLFYNHPRDVEFLFIAEEPKNGLVKLCFAVVWLDSTIFHPQHKGRSLLDWEVVSFDCKRYESRIVPMILDPMDQRFWVHTQEQFDGMREGKPMWELFPRREE